MENDVFSSTESSEKAWLPNKSPLGNLHVAHLPSAVTAAPPTQLAPYLPGTPSGTRTRFFFFPRFGCETSTDFFLVPSTVEILTHHGSLFLNVISFLGKSWAENHRKGFVEWWKNESFGQRHRAKTLNPSGYSQVSILNPRLNWALVGADHWAETLAQCECHKVLIAPSNQKTSLNFGRFLMNKIPQPTMHYRVLAPVFWSRVLLKSKDLENRHLDIRETTLKWRLEAV